MREVAWSALIGRPETYDGVVLDVRRPDDLLRETIRAL
jgi:hypothetical protein